MCSRKEFDRREMRDSGFRFGGVVLFFMIHFQLHFVFALVSISFFWSGRRIVCSECFFCSSGQMSTNNG